MFNAEKTEEGPRGPEGGTGPDHVAYVSVLFCRIIICRLYKSTLPDQDQVTLQLRVSPPPPRFSVKSFNLSTLTGGRGGHEKCFTPGTGPILGDPFDLLKPELLMCL
jgi:hypothetical protein